VQRMQPPSTYSYFLGSSLPPPAERLSAPELVEKWPGSNSTRLIPQHRCRPPYPATSCLCAGPGCRARHFMMRGCPSSRASEARPTPSLHSTCCVGGQTRFWPSVFNGKEGMAVRGLSATSPAAELAREYLDGSDIARPLIISALTGYSGDVATSQ